MSFGFKMSAKIKRAKKQKHVFNRIFFRLMTVFSRLMKSFKSSFRLIALQACPSLKNGLKLNKKKTENCGKKFRVLWITLWLKF